jgi:methyl-accepting chemotaxis protein
MIGKVRAGSGEVTQTGIILEEISKRVHAVVEISEKIRLDAAEQQKSIEQVNSAMVALDSITQHNSALVEEAASASEEIASQAEELLTTPRFFSLESRREAESFSATSRGFSPDRTITTAPQPGS